MGQPRPFFCLFSLFQKQILQKAVCFSGIRTRIVGIEGEHADHLTTTTAFTELHSSPQILHEA